MTESWTISVGGRVYGPYSLEQMQGFHAEKRLADHSLVARAGEEKFHPACEDSFLAALFEAATPSEAAQPARFGARADTESGGGTPSHFVIIVDMKSRSTSVLEEDIYAMGQAHQFGQQAWVLTSEVSINTIRTTLVQKLGKLDTLFIVDATNDKAAWFNFGPEADTRIRKMWSRPTEQPGTERRSVSRP